MSITIKRSVDIEDAVRIALSEHMTAYCNPLPARYALPFVRVSGAGGTSRDAIDSFVVALEGYADNEAEACEITRNAVGVLKYAAGHGDPVIRYVEENTHAQLFNDPIRPDLSRYRTTVVVVAHIEEATI
jgi:hypothetical protein